MNSGLPIMLLRLNRASRRAARGSRFFRQHHRTGLDQRLEVREDARPAAGHRLDESRLRPIDPVNDAQLYSFGAFDLLDFEGAERITLGLQFRTPFVTPFDDETPGRIRLDDLAGIGNAAIRKAQLPRRARLPVALAKRTEPILLRELLRGQRGPQTLRRGFDVGDVDKSRVTHFSSPSRRRFSSLSAASLPRSNFRIQRSPI